MGDGALAAVATARAAVALLAALLWGHLLLRRGYGSHGSLRLGLMGDYKFLFSVNQYPVPSELYWPLVSLWWLFHGGFVGGPYPHSAGRAGDCGSSMLFWRRAWARGLLLDPVFGASALAVAGYILFMTWQNHPQPQLLCGGSLLLFLH